ncbi:exonuclease subunit SbcD [Proteus mirabilis]|mgnify:FL=1|uniref:exonuclease subunit SbcD n=1 Tax=Proteus mirabilis TaxID=584 RepID=UPI000D8C5A7F|nr:exonuclease subunit SbcD [Proteus mirabilis]EKW1743296.1 exonuclease subunit SbcD [Proteus mirabilis]EMC9358336.1 exonuclease subunit SbcD [Proteus mirabilis]EMD6180059.1 exonuclease subunit SbcD [Proteus mirabilis]MBB6661926.1 exonuclease subunit SbcD [Proteus mirabilis]MBB6705469.1 exonuclease subunit SbcD [Proteus mirabilis]
MRIIHTSDWHLGQYFFTKTRAQEHQQFLDWLLAQIREQQVDAVIVAGDIFDTGSPPSYARELYNRFIVAIRDTQCQLIILGGNHDSVATLNESKSLLACLNTTVIANVHTETPQAPIILYQKNHTPGALLCAIPYLRPRDMINSKSGQSGADKQGALKEAIADYYQRQYQAALDLRKQLNVNIPIIATGHLTTIGASVSDSVREIYIGTLEAFNATLFPPFDYIALGHIHRPQRVNKSGHIRYSGSPIPLSFDESAQQKSVCLIDFEQDKLAEMTLLPIPEFQLLRTLSGSLQEIATQLEKLATQYNEMDTTIWLDIEVSTQDYLSDIQTRIQELTQSPLFEVIVLRRARKQRQALMQNEKEILTELTVYDVFERRLAQHQFETEEDKTRLTTLFKQAVEMAEQEDNNAR